jgi:hypothetical protein
MFTVISLNIGTQNVNNDHDALHVQLLALYQQQHSAALQSEQSLRLQQLLLSQQQQQQQQVLLALQQQQQQQQQSQQHSTISHQSPRGGPALNSSMQVRSCIFVSVHSADDKAHAHTHARTHTHA